MFSTSDVLNAFSTLYYQLVMGLLGLKSRMICVRTPLLTFSLYERESKVAGLHNELWTLAQHEAASPRSPQPGHGSLLSFSFLAL